jgi:spermidine synthase
MDDSWFLEKHTPHAGLSLAIRERLFEATSPYQRVEVLDTFEYGRMLLLDGYVMLTDRDEFVYHEMIVHPALLSHAAPEQVLIVGGGDGGSVREVLKHSSVRSVHLVELDKMVIDTSRSFFPALSEMLDDPRVEVTVADGFHHVENSRADYDVIIVDSIDPIGEAAKLFDIPFYTHAKGALREGGVFVCQTESPFYNGDVMQDVSRKLRGLYAHTAPFLANIPTYPSGCWSFCFASDAIDPLNCQPRFDQGFISQLKYYTPDLFRAAFTLPKYLCDLVAAG